MPVVPALDPLGVLDALGEPASARPYSTSTDADDPIMRYPRAASASCAAAAGRAMASSISPQPSSIRPVKTNTEPSVAAMLIAAGRR